MNLAYASNLACGRFILWCSCGNATEPVLMWRATDVIVASIAILTIWPNAATLTHIVPLVPHVLDRCPPHAFRVELLDGTELQVALVSAPANVDVAQVDGTAGVLPGTQHVGTYRPGAVHRIVALHWGTFRGQSTQPRPWSIQYTTVHTLRVTRHPADWRQLYLLEKCIGSIDLSQMFSDAQDLSFQKAKPRQRYECGSYLKKRKKKKSDKRRLFPNIFAVWG